MTPRNDHGPERTLELPRRSAFDPHALGIRLGARGTVVLDSVFNGPRGRPLGLRGMDGVDLDDASSHGTPAPNVLRLALCWPWREPAHIRVAADQGSLELVKYIARGEDGAPVAVIPHDPGGAGARVHLPGGQDWEEVSNALDPVGHLDSLDRRLDELGRDEDEHVPARRFFAELDRATNPFLLKGLVARGRIHREDAELRALAVESLGNELRQRIQVRCRGLDERAGTCLRLEERVLSHLLSKCRTISQLFLALVEEHFGSDHSAFERAFEWFANGALRMTLPSLVVTLQPSSGNFFLFGELALMAHDHGIEPERWKRLANVMVRSQRIFARVYAPDSLAGATFSSYSAGDYARRGRPFTEAELLRLAEEFRDADLPLATARHAAASLPGLRA